MPKVALPSDWLSRFFDPYAVLGIPLTADDRRITKRLRTISKVLHPDVQSADTARELATLMLAKVVNPAYERLKQEKGRNEIKALLRLHVRKLNRDQPWHPESEIARQLLQHPASNVEVFYEQAVSTLAAEQYQPLAIANFEAVTQQLVELNFAYFQLTMGEGFFRSERRTGVLPAAAAKPQQFTPTPAKEVRQESYDRRHYRRANQYMKRTEWPLAVQELREAIKIKADEADYHALLGIAYHYQKLNSMAKVYLRQALKLQPDHTLAVRYATRLGMDLPASKTGPSQPGQPKTGQPKTGLSRPGQKPLQNNGKVVDSSRTGKSGLKPNSPKPDVSKPDDSKPDPVPPDRSPQAAAPSTGLLGWLRELWGAVAVKK